MHEEVLFAVFRMKLRACYNACQNAHTFMVNILSWYLKISHRTELIIKFKYMSGVVILEKGLRSQKNDNTDGNNCIKKTKA